MAATAWPDYSGSNQLQFAQMLGIPQSGWYQNQGGYSDVWFPSQGGFTDASMMAAINAKLQPSPDVWIQQMMAQAGASQSQMLQQQIMQRQMAQSGTTPQSESVSKGGQAKSPGMTPMAPPGISSTTPLKAGSNVAVPGDKPGPKPAASPAAMSSERLGAPPNEAGAKAGQLLLNLVNNKEEVPAPQGAGAALLQQLKGGGKKADPQGHNDHGAGMALLQQVKNGTGTSGAEKGAPWWKGKTTWAEAPEWEDWGHGKAAGKKGKSDRGAWSGDWWSYGQDWSEEWPERWAPSAPQWGKTSKKGGGKAKATGKSRQESSQESSEGSNDSDSSNQPQAGANSRWRQRKTNEKGAGRGKGQPADKTRWKPAGKSNGK